MTTIYDEFDTVYAKPDTAIDDSGAEHGTLQSAIDNATDWVLIGPGAFSEAVTISGTAYDNFDLIGSGRSSFIDATGLDDNAVTVDGPDDVTLRDLRVENDGTGGNAVNITNGVRATVKGVVVEDSANDGIAVDQNNSEIVGLYIKAAGRDGVKTGGSGVAISSCVVGDVTRYGFQLNNLHTVLNGFSVRGPADNGIWSRTDADDTAIGNGSIKNPSTDGIQIGGDDVLMANVTVQDAGGDGIILNGSDTQLANVKTVRTAGTALDDSSATSPRYSNVVADGTAQDNLASPVTDSEWVSRLVDSPNASIANAVLDDGDSAEVSVPVPDTETIKIYRWGAYKISDGTTPTDLDMELKDGSDTVQTTENTGDTESTDPATPVTSHTNGTGSVSIYKIAVSNDTGGTIADPGVGAFAAYIVE